MQQLFNSENFVKIFYEENSKGFYIEGKYSIFKPIRKITKSIVKINKNLKTKEYKTINLQKKANRVKKKLKTKKYNKLRTILSELEKKIENDSIDFSVSKLTNIAEKPIYTIRQEKTKPEIFFVLKQVQKNIQNSFKVNQSDRHEIINQVINMLDNYFSKFVIRTDIRSFFESISHSKLMGKINKNHILNLESKTIIYEILNQYSRLSNSNKGIPRGIGISSYLAELYMRDIDDKIRALPNITYYARYVDDIILIFTPNTKYDKVCYLKQVVKIIKHEELQLNGEKTKSFNLHEAYNIDLDFLGYKILKCKQENQNIDISITESKFEKYKKKIDLLVEDYNKINKYDERSARKLLRNRLKYLTGNTRLLNVKKDILIGIYFSNILLTNTSKLGKLDKYLQNKLCSLKPYQKLNISTMYLDKLKKYSFKRGFEEKIFYKFDKRTLELILRIWKDL